MTRPPPAGFPPGQLSRRAMLTATLATAGASLLAACRPATEDPSRASTTPTATGASAVILGKVGILTEDIDRSLAFYRRLGLDVPTTADGQSYYRLPAQADTVLFWETVAAVQTFDPTWSLPAPAGRRVALEFGFATVDALEHTYQRLVASGAPTHLAPFDLGDGISYAVIEDPDGNEVSLRHPATG